MMLRVIIESAGGDHVRVNLPVALVKVAIETGMAMPKISSKINDTLGEDALSNLDFAQILKMVELGAIGNLVDIESANGDIVKVFVE